MIRSGMSRDGATWIGCVAILLWSLLAALTVGSGQVPPFQLAAMTFAVGGAVGALAVLATRSDPRAFQQPAPVWALGVGGPFGYHALYFAALRLSPPAEAGLINYLWPLLIVLFSAFLPGERLRPLHVGWCAPRLRRRRAADRRPRRAADAGRAPARLSLRLCRRVRMGGLLGPLAVRERMTAVRRPTRLNKPAVAKRADQRTEDIESQVPGPWSRPRGWRACPRC